MDSIILFGIIAFTFLTCIAILFIFSSEQQIKIQSQELLEKIQSDLHIRITQFDDDEVVVKSRQTLNNYSDLKYIKNNNNYEKIKKIVEDRNKQINRIESFLIENDYQTNPHYNYVIKRLKAYLRRIKQGYKIHIAYITAAGNNLGEKNLYISESRLAEIDASPELSLVPYHNLLAQGYCHVQTC